MTERRPCAICKNPIRRVVKLQPPAPRTAEEEDQHPPAHWESVEVPACSSACAQSYVFLQPTPAEVVRAHIPFYRYLLGPKRRGRR